jgi:hypothetical protein
VTELRATVHDPGGPLHVRLLVSAIGLTGVLAGLVWCFVDERSPGADFFSGFALLLVGPMLLGRHAPRQAELVTGTGRVEVRGAGILTQVLHARDVTGTASTPLEGGKVALHIQRSRRDAPTLLVMGSEENAKRVRDALGIGTRGAGAVTWPVGARAVDRLRRWSRIFGAIAAAMLAYASFTGGDATAYSGWPLSYLVIVLSLASIATLSMERADRRRRTVTLTPTTVLLEDARDGFREVPLADISGVAEEDGWLVLSRDRGRSMTTKIDLVRRERRGLTPLELSYVVLAIDAAARRARADVDVTPALGTTSILGRASGEPARHWLARLEATAVELRRAVPYRDVALGQSDLWSTLGDHDAEPDLRAACARVLSRVADAADLARIDAVAATIHDHDASLLVRVALEPDVERAAEWLDALDARYERDAEA